jgi:hypothetical protein
VLHCGRRIARPGRWPARRRREESPARPPR